MGDTIPESQFFHFLVFALHAFCLQDSFIGFLFLGRNLGSSFFMNVLESVLANLFLGQLGGFDPYILEIDAPVKRIGANLSHIFSYGDFCNNSIVFAGTGGYFCNLKLDTGNLHCFRHSNYGRTGIIGFGDILPRLKRRVLPVLGGFGSRSIVLLC